MDLFDCYNIFKDENIKKRAIKLEAIAHKRTAAVANRIKVAKASIANNDMNTFCEVMRIDTKLFSKMVDSLPEDERKQQKMLAVQATEEQKKRLDAVQYQEYLKRQKLAYFLMTN